ncbi:MAG: GAF domain-containing protein [Candidatus Cohnella colombiensis]|uniref:GAF domain-containing protein n=1 Tax=Candidatus Cohnella colombiensis TaxID=3121368 RepID=A0AA95F4S8_9BACL|nr:MAG: GAF domain-containing protein [Cohnella sp.]
MSTNEAVSTLLNRLNDLKERINCEFVSIALVDNDSGMMKWRWAWGNLNDRYLFIEHRPNHGLSGQVMKIGRGIAWQRKELEEKRLLNEYSIMLVERLQSVYAVPVKVKVNTKFVGVLLIGDRTEQVYDQLVRDSVNEAADQVGEIVSNLL